MKKIPILLTGLFLTMFAQANDHTIVIRGTSDTNIDKTTVVGGGNSDTLTVRPAVDASVIFVTLKGVDGTILAQHQCAATWNDQVTIIAPSYLPNGYFLEVRDDKGFVYKEFNQ